MTATGHQDFGEELAAIFAILPDRGAAAQALEEAHAALDGGLGSCDVPWVEFAPGGQPLRLAVTSLDTQATAVFLAPGEHPDLAVLVNACDESVMARGAIRLHPRDDRKLLWFAPCASISPERDRRPAATMRGIAINMQVFTTMMAGVFEQCGVTPAEQRTLFQLAGGVGPQDAAQMDRVSPETKRTQIKSLCAKLECSGQTDLVRLALNQLSPLQSSATIGMSSAKIAEHFVRRHMPSSIRLTFHLLDNGRTLRTFECGPASGRPVVMVHGALFAMLLLNSPASMEALGVRLIVPIRRGYLEGEPSPGRNSIDRQADQDDLALFVRRFRAPLPVIGSAVGAIWAMELVLRHPTLASRLILLSPNFLAAESRQQGVRAFIGNLLSSNRRTGLLRVIIGSFTRRFAAQNLLRDTLSTACKEEQSDLAVIEGRLGEGALSEWFADALASSNDGVADDLSTRTEHWRRFAAAIRCPVTIAASPSDPMGQIEIWEDDPDLRSVEFRRFPAVGHLTDASHAADIWAAVGDLLA